MKYRGPNTQVKDLASKMVLPGFQDVHIHPVAGGVAYSGCPMFDLTTVEQVFEKLSECADSNPEASYIKGQGWNWGMFIDSEGPNRHQLDLLEAHRPVVLGDSDGLLMVSQQEMLQAVPALDAEGFQIHIHAIGDGTVRYALDALEQAKLANGVRDSRHLTAHTQLVDPADIPRFEQLGVIAGFSPYWAYADDYIREINGPQLGPERLLGHAKIRRPIPPVVS